MKYKWIKRAVVLLLPVMLAGCGRNAAGDSQTTLGMEAIGQLAYSEAVEDFNQALQDGEDEVMAYRGLGLAYMGLARYEEAVDAFEHALALTDEKMPETMKDILLYEASALYRLKDYEETVRVCGKLIDLDSQTAEAFYLRGAAYLKQQNEDQAHMDFDQAVKLTPEDYSLYLNIYETYEEQKLSALGDEYLQTALHLTPKTEDDYYRIGQIYYYLEQYDLAQSTLVTPVEQGYMPARYLMGKIYLAQEDYVHAQAMYEDIQKADGESAETYNGLVLCSLAAGEYDQALALIAKGLACDGESGKQELYFNEIVAYERKLDFSAAKEKAQAYVAAYPTDEAAVKELDFLSTRK